MDNSKNIPKENAVCLNKNFLGRMTNEEYEAMWNGDKKLPTYRSKNLGRLTDKEYKALPYGNNKFYEQFEKE